MGAQLTYRPLTPWRPRSLADLWYADPPASWSIADADAARRDREERDRLALEQVDRVLGNGDVPGAAEAALNVALAIWARFTVQALIRWMRAPEDVRAAHLVPEDVQ